MTTVTPEHRPHQGRRRAVRRLNELDDGHVLHLQDDLRHPDEPVQVCEGVDGDRDDGRGWKLCCPVGHTWWYTGKQTEAERMKEQLERARNASTCRCRSRPVQGRRQGAALPVETRSQRTAETGDDVAQRRVCARAAAGRSRSSSDTLRRSTRTTSSSRASSRSLTNGRRSGLSDEGDPNA